MKPTGSFFAIVFVVLWAGLAGGGVQVASAWQAETEPPAPALTVTLERETLREGSPARLAVWVTNPSETPLQDVELHLSGPADLALREGGCTGTLLEPPVGLGDLAPHSLWASPDWCLALENPGQVGKLNLLFALTYGWEAGGQVRRGLVTVEKAVTLDVFGTDAVMGVPLAFAAFIVPGMFFLLVLGLFGAPWAKEMKGDEKLFYSVLVSALILAAGYVLYWVSAWPLWDLPFWGLPILNRLGAGAWEELLVSFNFGSQVSVGRLVTLAAAGGVLGLLGGLAHKKRVYDKARAEKRKAALEITPNDEPGEIVYKALALNPDYEGAPVLVRFKDGSEFVGAHIAELGDKTTLVGAFRVALAQLDPERRAQAAALRDPNTGEFPQKPQILARALALAGYPGEKPNPAAVEINNSIWKIENGKPVNTNLGKMYKFHDVTLAFYDFHATEQPLANSRPGDYYQPGFRFLVDQPAYRQAFNLRQRVASPQFNFYPLPGRDRRTHFWESYLDLTVNPAADGWLYQAPWVCRNLHVDLRLNGGPAGVTAELRKEIYLSALGWSTQVIVRLVGDLDARQLSAAVGRLARGSKTGPQAPFLLDGRPEDLTGVFQHLAGLIQEQVFVPGKNPHRSKYFPRKRLIAVAEFDAPPKNQRLFGGYDKLFQAEKADLQSVLFGRAVPVSQLKGDGELLRTVISGSNYALTDWNEGTLLFPLRDGFIKAGKCGKMHCLATNLRACQTMAFLLLEYIKAARTAPAGSAAQALRAQAQAALITIADRYCNAFCQHIFQKHPELSREVPPSPYRCG